MHFLLSGFTLIFRPGLKRFVFIPLLINLLLFIGLFFFAKHWIAESNQWLISFLPTWLQWLKTFLWIFFIVSFLLFMMATFFTFANIVAAPFNSLLAEKVAMYLTGQPSPEGHFFKDIVRNIQRQFAIVGYFIPRACILLLLFFVPIIQIFAAGIWFIFNAWLMTLQYVDYPADNARISFPDMRHQLTKKRGLAMTFGMSTLIFSMIPILNFLVMPAAVAGATKLWVEEMCNQGN